LLLQPFSGTWGQHRTALPSRGRHVPCSNVLAPAVLTEAFCRNCRELANSSVWRPSPVHSSPTFLSFDWSEKWTKPPVWNLLCATLGLNPCMLYWTVCIYTGHMLVCHNTDALFWFSTDCYQLLWTWVDYHEWMWAESVVSDSYRM